MFDVYYSRQATKFLRKAEKELTNRLLDTIESLREEPVPPDTKSVKGFKEKLFRVRVGDYRILYEVDYEETCIGVVKIDHRERVY